MPAYYNDHDAKVCKWLRELARRDLIAPGTVDERSVLEIEPQELAGYEQAHFFAGIGGWSYALRLAGWPDDRPVWTASLPCQPFSVAGRGEGTADDRHLWPAFRRLVAECRPPVLFGEQVASAAGRLWFAGVRADLEAMGYACGAADLCAAGVGAPHIRSRLFWVAAEWVEHSDVSRCATQRPDAIGHGEEGEFEKRRSGGRVADASGDEQRTWRAGETDGWTRQLAGCGHAHVADGGMGDSDGPRSQGRGERGYSAHERTPWAASLDNWLPCADGKARRIEPGLEPLAHGIPARVVRLRGYGNSIVPQVAAEFVSAFLDTEGTQ